MQKWNEEVFVARDSVYSLFREEMTFSWMERTFGVCQFGHLQYRDTYRSSAVYRSWFLLTLLSCSQLSRLRSLGGILIRVYLQSLAFLAVAWDATVRCLVLQ